VYQGGKVIEPEIESPIVYRLPMVKNQPNILLDKKN
jgi:hypothetical protein